MAIIDKYYDIINAHSGTSLKQMNGPCEPGLSVKRPKYSLFIRLKNVYLVI